MTPRAETLLAGVSGLMAAAFAAAGVLAARRIPGNRTFN